jgi:hypothetical protein
MLVLFIIGWCAAAAAWFYGTRFFIPMWASGFRGKDKHRGYARKALIGYGLFVAAILFCLLVGGLAQLAGGWG